MSFVEYLERDLNEFEDWRGWSTRTLAGYINERLTQWAHEHGDGHRS